ncbi:MAG: Calx-beta domain-containing protein [Pyrinomonadaceae bacterium]
MTSCKNLLLVFVFLALFCSVLGRRAVRAENLVSTVSITGSPDGPEGNAGFTSFNFTLTRTGDLSTPCTASFETQDGTAFAPEDYNAVTGSVTFTAGQASVVVPVTVIGDIYLEFDESFLLRLTGSSNCEIGTAGGTAWIDNEENPGVLHGVEGDLETVPNAALRINDVVLMRRLILGLDAVPNSFVFQKADINGDCGDGLINSADVSVLRQWILAGNQRRDNCGPTGPIAGNVTMDRIRDGG